MLTKIYANEVAPISYHIAIFLAGPTPRKSQDQSWRTEALEILSNLYKNQTISVVVFIPEAQDGHGCENYVMQVEWEKQHLEMSDAILTWVPRNMQTSLKGLTTNIEFGHYIRSGKLFYGRPDEADHIYYLDWMYQDVTKRPVTNNLTQLTEEVTTYLQSCILKLGTHSLRSQGERWVPLSIWTTTQFQNWYQSQLQVGNQLRSAKLLWVFSIDPINFIFSYALQVEVWIAQEKRVKSNEFIISRSDISVVVAYWKHPTDIWQSEVVLIKEFRSPARTNDGFVHELPGGSSFSCTNHNPLLLASKELFEETSLKMEAHRFQYLASKQIAATWSTHFADVYSIALTKQEIEHARQLASLGHSYGVEEDSERTYIEICPLKDIAERVDWSMEGMIYRAILGR